LLDQLVLIRRLTTSSSSSKFNPTELDPVQKTRSSPAMKIFRITLIGLALLCLAGCTTQERESVALANLKNGMTEAQLKDRLGTPTKVERNSDFIIWHYPAGMVFLKDGLVYSWKPEDFRP